MHDIFGFLNEFEQVWFMLFVCRLTGAFLQQQLPLFILPPLPLEVDLA